MQVQSVLRGTQQAEPHTQDVGTDDLEAATAHVPLLDRAPGQVYSGAANAQALYSGPNCPVNFTSPDGWQLATLAHSNDTLSLGLVSSTKSLVNEFETLHGTAASNDY